MSAKLQYTLLGLVAGLIGGNASHFLHSGLVYAQAPAPKLSHAQSFVLVNNAGAKIGELAVDADGKPNIKLFDDGRVIWSARGARFQPAR